MGKSKGILGDIGDVAHSVDKGVNDFVNSIPVVGSINKALSGANKGVNNATVDVGNFVGNHLGGVLGAAEGSVGGPTAALLGGVLGDKLQNNGLNGVGSSGGGGTPGQDYFDSQLGFYNTNNFPVEKAKEYLKSQGVDLNDKKTINSYLSQWFGSPSFINNQSSQSNPLAMQILMSQLIQPYLKDLTAASNQGIGAYDQAMSGLENSPGLSPESKSFDLASQKLADNSARQSNVTTQQNLANAPALDTILGLLRQQYEQGLTSLVNPASTTIPSANLPASQAPKPFSANG